MLADHLHWTNEPPTRIFDDNLSPHPHTLPTLHPRLFGRSGSPLSSLPRAGDDGDSVLARREVPDGQLPATCRAPEKHNTQRGFRAPPEFSRWHGSAGNRYRRGSPDQPGTRPDQTRKSGSVRVHSATGPRLLTPTAHSKGHMWSHEVTKVA